MKCSVCGKELVEGAAFCMFCGSPTEKTCPNCSAKLPADAVFCYKCGSKVGGKSADVVRSVNTASTPTNRKTTAGNTIKQQKKSVDNILKLYMVYSHIGEGILSYLFAITPVSAVEEVLSRNGFSKVYRIITPKKGEMMREPFAMVYEAVGITVKDCKGISGRELGRFFQDLGSDKVKGTVYFLEKDDSASAKSKVIVGDAKQMLNDKKMEQLSSISKKKEETVVSKGAPVWNQTSSGVCDCAVGECDCDGSIWH